ncbi:uncharacterized protein LOC119444661 [Dermacentor silvarum]|uniref:uncharacterized protein LOC119444661 n=1 Tax=Dermacentor silvarum TaxID=543639 RepID=UPI0021016755|nr:uncharacterized protein LOC119444661 [Dermacentor silvarum]
MGRQALVDASLRGRKEAPLPESRPFGCQRPQRDLVPMRGGHRPIFSLVIAVASSLHILHLSVPKWVQNGTEDSVVLDCVYNANREDEHLVIKWFLNDDPQPIYQWIPELNKRFVSSRLKDRINLDYSLTNGNSFTKFRALNLVRPTTELSGRYSCHVMSLAGQDSESKLMTVYAPPKRFDFTFERVSAHVTNLSCEVDGVFPQPTLFLYQSSGRDPVSRPVASAPARLAPPTPAEGAAGYHVRLTYALDSRTLDASGHVEYVFECVLAIPETNFRQQRRLEFEPGKECTVRNKEYSSNNSTTEIAEPSTMQHAFSMGPRPK